MLILCVVGECKEFMMKYMECLKRNDHNGGLCRDESREYLQCRMEKWVIC